MTEELTTRVEAVRGLAKEVEQARKAFADSMNALHVRPGMHPSMTPVQYEAQRAMHDAENRFYRSISLELVYDLDAERARLAQQLSTSEARAEQMQAALEWYAREGNYKERHWQFPHQDEDPPVMDDKGRRARAALEVPNDG